MQAIIEVSALIIQFAKFLRAVICKELICLDAKEKVIISKDSHRLSLASAPQCRSLRLRPYLMNAFFSPENGLKVALFLYRPGKSDNPMLEGSKGLRTKNRRITETPPKRGSFKFAPSLAAVNAL